MMIQRIAVFPRKQSERAVADLRVPILTAPSGPPNDHVLVLLVELSPSEARRLASRRPDRAQVTRIVSRSGARYNGILGEGPALLLRMNPSLLI